MIKAYLKFYQGIPQYACTSCSDCKSVFGKSLCSIKNRGCCWYFPKFTLHEIHKMVKNKDGLETLDKVLKIPKTKVYNYYIYANGYFDEFGYKKYIERKHLNHCNVEDKSIFFRACPFVAPGVGCTMNEKYRSYVCNLYICDEILNELENLPSFYHYIKERNNYVKWIEWENKSLEMLLKEKDLNLIRNLQEVIALLKDIPLDAYDFPCLEPVEVAM